MNALEKVLKVLIEEQQDDGGFGRFHTMDSKAKRKVPTTEAAAWLMYENGINCEMEVCNKTCLYMEQLLDNLQLWPDSLGKNIYFTAAVPLFIASKLALFTSKNVEYIKIRDTWITILISAFQLEQYSEERANEISEKLIGIKIDQSYIGLHSLNCLALYAKNTDKIPTSIQLKYLQWLHNFEGVITYTNIKPNNLISNQKSARVISLLSKFKGFEKEFSNLLL